MLTLGQKYELGERIGGGGMADVFRGIVHGAEGFTRPVAIKRIKASISTDPKFGQMFTDEARLAARLMHPNIVQTIDFDRDKEGCYYIVMELIEGVDLRHLVSTGPVPHKAVVYIMAEVLRALDYAHEMVADGHAITVVHRDVSPHNVMLGWQGSVKLVDFGIAKAIERSGVRRSGALKGKVSYMSPEQVHGEELDGRSDLFAVGVMMHELLTASRLFSGDSDAATLSRLLNQPIPRPSQLNSEVPSDVEAIVMKLLERDRGQRFSRAREALEALLDCDLMSAKGRFDLETVLGERFPSRVPKRVARLSSAPSRAADFARNSELESGESAPPLAALKKTFTAAGADASPPLERPGRSPLLRMFTIGIGVAALVLVAWFALRIAEEDKSASAGLEVIAVLGGDAGTTPSVSPAAALPTEDNADAAGAADAGVATAPFPDAASPNQVAKTPDRPNKAKKSATTPPKKKKVPIKFLVKPWALVEVDGRSYGQTPRTISLKVGKRRIVLTNPPLGKRESFVYEVVDGKDNVIQRDWM